MTFPVIFGSVQWENFLLPCVCNWYKAMSVASRGSIFPMRTGVTDCTALPLQGTPRVSFFLL